MSLIVKLTLSIFTGKTVKKSTHNQTVPNTMNSIDEFGKICMELSQTLRIN